MSSYQPNRTDLFTFCLTTCATAGLCTSVAPATPVDLAFPIIDQLTQVGKRPARAGDPVPLGNVGDEIAGFTLRTRARNVGASPISWGFPVIESLDNPWIMANVSAAFPNGFTGQEGAGNHQHTRSTFAQVSHPHILFYIYRQPATGQTTTLIGRSHLKHTYRVGGFEAGDPRHHELATMPPGQEDDYATVHNQDQSFFSPPDEDGFNPTTGMLVNHNHLGSYYRGANMDDRERDHGELNFTGGMFPGGEVMPADPGHPGADNIDHLLQVRVVDLNPAMNPTARWFLAGEYFVVDEIDRSDNSRWIEILPSYDGTTFTFTYGTGDFDITTIPKIPEPLGATMWAVGAGLLATRRLQRVV
jgi:hypothetical protein